MSARCTESYGFWKTADLSLEWFRNGGEASEAGRGGRGLEMR